MYIKGYGRWFCVLIADQKYEVQFLNISFSTMCLVLNKKTIRDLILMFTKKLTA